MEKNLKSLREYILEARQKKVAIGHFNISNLEGLHAIFEGAQELDLPVIIGLSEGEEGFVGTDEAVALVSMLRTKHNYPIFLNADHHASFESVKKCIDAGFDMVIIDCSKLSFEENVALTKKCVLYAKEISTQTGRDILVESELGYIGSGSNIKDSIPEGAGVLTDPAEAKKFVEATGINLLAPSIGSVHGIIKSGKPHIDKEVTKSIYEACGVPLVLHGGSGLRDEDFLNAIESGVAVVHINSELRLAFRDAVLKSLTDMPEEINPVKILTPAKEAMKAVVINRLKLFNGIK